MDHHPLHPGAPHWHPAARQRRQLPAELRDWLLDTASLTRRLQERCQGHVSVELITLGWGRPRYDEAQALGVAPRQRALIRQVRLCCDAKPWVFARTVIPLRALRGAQRRLTHLGARPLGAYLCADPSLQRSALQLLCLPGNHPLLAAAAEQKAPVWGRRSVFRLQGHPLLVSEFFLPELPPFQSRVSHE
ncbi:MAG TPA: chorismate lyase [Gammaproteobacteria bacterium]